MRRCISSMMGAIAAVAMFSSAPAGARDRDYCKHLLPRSLTKRLARVYPDYRPLPSSYTNISDIEYAKTACRSCCYYIASGDFNNDGHVDYALILKNKHEWSLVVVVALRQRNSWAFAELVSKHDNNNNPYIETLPPDEYGGLGLIDPDYQEQGQPDHIASSADGILYGTVDSSGCAYFLVGDKWVHMWLSD